MGDVNKELPGAVAETAVTRYFGVQRGSGAKEVDPITALTDFPVGVVQNETVLGAGTVTAGSPAQVVYEGQCIAEAGAAIAAFQEIQFNAAGKVIVAVATGRRCGIALDAASGDGSQINIDLDVRNVGQVLA